MSLDEIRQMTEKARREKSRRGETEEKEKLRAEQQRSKELEKLLKVDLVRDMKVAAKNGLNHISTGATDEAEAKQIAAHFSEQGYKTEIGSGVDWKGNTSWDVRITW